MLVRGFLCHHFLSGSFALRCLFLRGSFFIRCFFFCGFLVLQTKMFHSLRLLQKKAKQPKNFEARLAFLASRSDFNLCSKTTAPWLSLCKRRRPGASTWSDCLSERAFACILIPMLARAKKMNKNKTKSPVHPLPPSLAFLPPLFSLPPLSYPKFQNILNFPKKE